MKKHHILLYANLMICIVILIGFTGTVWISHQTYKRIIEDDIENISKLTSSNIYAEINGELTKPIFVAQTMASDSFLKQWLYDEKTAPEDRENARKLQEYLYAYRMKYEYDSVFMISSSSNIYYYFDGVNKVVSPENEHDDWYYDFLESGESYRLNIDTDEVNQNELTVFVDCRVEDTNGELLGVTGVGVKMSRLQELLRQHEEDYQLEAFLINRDGEVQVDTDQEKIGAFNLFDASDLRHLREAIIGNRETMEMHWYPENQMDNCIITRYIANMDWYLVVQKNTQAIRSSFQELVRKDILIITVMIALLLAISSVINQRFNAKLVKILNTDSLTELPNQQSFAEAFGRGKHSAGLLFLFDVDHFKRINDTKGHMFGNRILYTVAAIAKACVGDKGAVARWGGDEFIGVLFASAEEGDAILRRIQQGIVQGCGYYEGDVRISVGVTRITESADLESLTAQADQALYYSKGQGGDMISRYWEIFPELGEHEPESSAENRL